MFIFDSTIEEKESLLNKLEGMGLEKISENQEYIQKIWEFKCKWQEDTLKLVFEQEWINDGKERQDIGVSIYLGSKLIANSLFEKLQNKNTPLRESITNFILENSSVITGKHA
jgi:hypothetical protein